MNKHQLIAGVLVLLLYGAFTVMGFQWLYRCSKTCGSSDCNLLLPGLLLFISGILVTTTVRVIRTVLQEGHDDN